MNRPRASESYIVLESEFCLWTAHPMNLDGHGYSGLLKA